MSNPRVETIRTFFEYANQTTRKLAGDFPAEHRLRQPAQGRGHALWQVGHLTFSNDLFVVNWCCGEDSLCPPAYSAAFAPDIMGGTPVTANPEDYPGWDEVIAKYAEVGARVIDALGRLTDADLDGEMKGNVPEQAKNYFGTLGQSLVGLAAHEAHHRGQLALLKSVAA